jgi:lipopolysaccharide transport system permease protein
MSSMLTDCREMLAEQVTYRELLYQMTKRDLLLRYKQTVMGFGWAVFMPLVNTIVFSVVFMRVANIQTPVPYPLFAFCGLLVWNFFASSLKFAVGSLISNYNLVTKVYFPREIFPFSSVIVCFIDFGVASLVLIAFMAYYHVVPGLSIIALPFVVLVQVAFTCGVALLVSMANLFFRDVKYIFEIVLTVWMFATSVLYPVEMINGKLGAVMRANPMTPIIDAYRQVLFYGQWPTSQAFLIASFISFATLFIGWLAFHRAEFKFAESI